MWLSSRLCFENSNQYTEMMFVQKNIDSFSLSLLLLVKFLLTNLNNLFFLHFSIDEYINRVHYIKMRISHMTFNSGSCHLQLIRNTSWISSLIVLFLPHLTIQILDSIKYKILECNFVNIIWLTNGKSWRQNSWSYYLNVENYSFWVICRSNILTSDETK